MERSWGREERGEVRWEIKKRGESNDRWKGARGGAKGDEAVRRRPKEQGILEKEGVGKQRGKLKETSKNNF